MSGNPTPYNRATVWAWSLYDFANSAFTTLVVTFVYAAYFTRGIAENEVSGTVLWSRAVAATAIVVALLSPYVGTIADRGGYRKRFLLISTVVCIGATVALFFPGSGQTSAALFWFIVANIAFEMGNVFYNAFLPDIAPQERIGRISGYGWALGYAGGLLCLVVALFTLIYPAEPLFGFSKIDGSNIRASNLLVAVWFALFSIPMFVIVRERKSPPRLEGSGLLQSTTRQFLNTFREIRTYRQVFRLLLARLVYNDGLITIFAFGGIIAQNLFGFTFAEITVFGIALNLSAGLGAFLFGYLDDRIGGKKTILISLVGLAFATIIVIASSGKIMLWIAGLMIGLLAGPNQSASRSLLGRFVPLNKENEFYGFFAFSGKATAFMGPLLLGTLTDLFDSERAGITAILLFFAVGALLLLRVDEKEGVRLAGRTETTIT